MALATQPRLLLLDEPWPAWGRKSPARMLGMLRQLKGSMTILLIEHDIGAVFALADRLTVLVDGRIIATGQPETVEFELPSGRRIWVKKDKAVMRDCPMASLSFALRHRDQFVSWQLLFKEWQTYRGTGARRRRDESMARWECEFTDICLDLGRGGYLRMLCLRAKFRRKVNGKI